MVYNADNHKYCFQKMHFSKKFRSKLANVAQNNTETHHLKRFFWWIFVLISIFRIQKQYKIHKFCWFCKSLQRFYYSPFVIDYWTDFLYIPSKSPPLINKRIIKKSELFASQNTCNPSLSEKIYIYLYDPSDNNKTIYIQNFKTSDI